MYKYITILGAAGQIAQRLTATLLTYTDMSYTLDGRQLSTRHSLQVNFRTRTDNRYRRILSKS